MFGSRFFVVTHQGHSLLSAHLIFMVAVRLLCRTPIKWCASSEGGAHGKTTSTLNDYLQNVLATGVRVAVALQTNLGQHGVRPWTEQSNKNMIESLSSSMEPLNGTAPPSMASWMEMWLTICLPNLRDKKLEVTKAEGQAATTTFFSGRCDSSSLCGCPQLRQRRRI